VTILFINIDAATTYKVEQIRVSSLSSSLAVPLLPAAVPLLLLLPRLEYQLSATALSSNAVKLNGKTLTVVDGKLPTLVPKSVPSGGSPAISIPPHTISYVVLPEAKLPACA
jgi:hypothetical protein